MQLSAVNKRRWSRFKLNKRGYYSLWMFVFIFLLSLFSEFIANDKPYMITLNDKHYFPMFTVYPETVFGGEFETETEYIDPYVEQLITEQGGVMYWPPIRFSYDTFSVDLGATVPSAPSATHVLGTDDFGRDVFARILYGLRLSIMFGLLLTILSTIIGVIVGACQGYFAGMVDLIGQRFIEIWTSVPSLYVLIILASLFSPGFFVLLFIMLLFSWVSLVGVVRAEFLRGRNYDYIKAVRVMGLGPLAIMFRHLLPNAMVATLTFLPFILNGAIATLSALDFLGLGLPPGSASLGELLRQGKENPNAPWLGFTSFIVISVLLSLLIFIGEAVRDAFDTNKKSAVM